MVMITNFNNTAQNIVLNQYGGTGNTNCSILTDAAICAGNSATVVAANSSTLTSPVYSMNPGSVTNATGSFVVTPLTTTSYTTYVTGFNSQNIQVTQTSTTIVTVNPQPLTSLTMTQTTCTSTLNGINLGLSFNPGNPVPGYTVNWSPQPGVALSPTQSVVYGGIPPATYTAVVTATGGCSSTVVATIAPPPAAAVFTLSPPGGAYTVSCAQPTVYLDATAPSYNYTWTNGVVAPQTGSSTAMTRSALGAGR